MSVTETWRAFAHSRLLSAGLLVFGIAMFACAIVYGDRQIDAIQGEVRLMEDSLASLHSDVERLQVVVDSLQYTPLAALIVPRSIAVPTGRRDGQRRPLYHYAVWLDLPEGRKAEIESVSYTFDHPSFIEKVRTSAEPSSGFAIGYLGWGTLGTLPIDVALKDGSSFELTFAWYEEVIYPD